MIAEQVLTPSGMVVGSGLVALGWAALLVRRGVRREKHLSKVRVTVWGVIAALMVPATVSVVHAFQAVNHNSAEKAVMGNLRQLTAAEEQFLLEFGAQRIFISYNELIGPTIYVKAINPVQNEDYKHLFPFRRDLDVPVKATLPDGSVKDYSEELEITMPWGAQVTYGGIENDGPKEPDGVHTLLLADGRYFKVNYLNGVPDGPFKAYYADGVLWGEATYQRGQVVGPSWLYTRAGKRFDELADGPAAEAALEASSTTSGSDPAASGTQKLAAGDFDGAEADFSQAIAINPGDLTLFQSRGTARSQRGDLDGAIKDLGIAAGIPPGLEMQDEIRGPLYALYVKRAQLREKRHDVAGATSDYHIAAHSAIARDAATLSELIALTSIPELHAARARLRVAGADFQGAEADYTRAIDLAAQGKQMKETYESWESSPVNWRFERGRVRRLLHDFAGAEADLRAVASEPGYGISFDAAVWLYVVGREQNRPKEAASAIAAMHPGSGPGRDLNNMFIQFLQGAITEEQLILEAEESRYQALQFRAALLAGLLRRAAGDQEGAQARFRDARRIGGEDVIDRAALQAMLDADGAKQ